MIVLDVEQRSPEWFAARTGIPTASNFNNIFTSTGKSSTKAQNYMYQLAGERIAGAPTESYQNAAMLRGIEMEGEARELFKLVRDVEVREVGLCFTDDKRYSCSPDGLMGDTEGLEIKCPLIHTHVAYLLAGKVPAEYVPQVQGSMLVTGFGFWNFMSYFPGLPPLMLKVPRDDKYCTSLQVELDGFCQKLDGVTEQLRRLAA